MPIVLERSRVFSFGPDVSVGRTAIDRRDVFSYGFRQGGPFGGGGAVAPSYRYMTDDAKDNPLYTDDALQDPLIHDDQGLS